MADVPVFNSDANLAVGVQSRVMERWAESSRWGDWRFQAIVGATQMPRSHECFLGYEFFVSGGIARLTLADESVVRGTYGVEAGFPLRLAVYEPPWRSDDLVGVKWFLVPAVSAAAHGVARSADVTATLSLRISGWSAITP